MGTQKRLDDVTMQQARARGEIARLKASLEKAELNLSYTEIRAPLAGRIGRATVSVGNYVGPSSEPLATIVKQDPIYVSFPVTQREMLQIRKDKSLAMRRLRSTFDWLMAAVMRKRVRPILST